MNRNEGLDFLSADDILIQSQKLLCVRAHKFPSQSYDKAGGFASTYAVYEKPLLKEPTCRRPKL